MNILGIEVHDLGSGKYECSNADRHAVIDINDFTDEQIEKAVTKYYKSLRSLIDEYQSRSEPVVAAMLWEEYYENVPK